MENVDPNLLEIAEYLRESAKMWKYVGPRPYEGWEILVYAPNFPRPQGVPEEWRLSARRSNRRTPTDNDLRWLTKLAKAVSEDKAEGPFEATGKVEHNLNGFRDNITFTHYFTWSVKREDNDWDGFENDDGDSEDEDATRG